MLIRTTANYCSSPQSSPVQRCDWQVNAAARNPIGPPGCQFLRGAVAKVTKSRVRPFWSLCLLDPYWLGLPALSRNGLDFCDWPALWETCSLLAAVTTSYSENQRPLIAKNTPLCHAASRWTATIRPPVCLAQSRIGRIHMMAYHLSVLGLWLTATPPAILNVVVSEIIKNKKNTHTHENEINVSVGTQFAFSNRQTKNIYSYHIFKACNIKCDHV